MNTYGFNVQNGLLIAEAIEHIDSLTSIALSKPGFILLDDAINVYEYGIFKIKLTFAQIDNVNGVEPSSLSDAYDKLIDLVPASSGGGGGGGTSDATAANQVTGNTKLTSIDTKLSSQSTAAKQDESKTVLDNILLELKDDINASETVWYDRITPTLFYVRRSSTNQDSGAITVTFYNAAGTVASPTVANLVQVISGTDFEFNTVQRKAIASGTGYSIDDQIQELQIINMTTAAIVNTIWINKTTDTLIAAPTFANLVIDDTYANTAKQDIGNASLASIDGKLSSLGQKTSANSAPVVLASDQAPVNVVLTSSPTAAAAGLKATMTAYGYIRAALEPTVQFADSFDGGVIDTTDKWTQAGTVTVGTSSVSVGNVTTLNSVHSLTSKPTFPSLGISFQVLAWVGSFEANPLSTTNVNRFYGFHTHSGTPTVVQPATNGVGLEWDSITGKLWLAVYQSGVRSASSVDLSAYATSANTRYAILYRSDIVIAYIGSTEIPVASISFVTPDIQNLPIRFQTIIGASAPSTTPLNKVSAVAEGDTGGNATQIADGTNPFRKSRVDALGNLAVVTNTETSSGTITTQNLVSGGTATANSAVELSLNGTTGLAIQTTGTYTGALSLQVTNDGTNWITIGGTPFLNMNTSGLLATITSALQGAFQAEVAGFLKARITALAAVTGTVTVTLRSVTNTSMVAIDSPLPTGTNSIGNVGTVATVSAVTTLQNGQAAHSSPVTGSPLRTSGKVVPTTIATQDTTLVANDTSDTGMTTALQTLVKQNAPSELDYNFIFSTVGTVVTPQVLVQQSGTALIRNYVKSLRVSTDVLGAAGTVYILDGALTISSIAITTGLATTSVAHDFKIGDAIIFTALASGTGVNTLTVYYVTSVGSTTTFNFALTPGGSNVVPSVAYTSSTGYRIFEQIRLQTAALTPTPFLYDEPLRSNPNMALNLLIPASLTSGNIYITINGYRGF